ncbi:MAG: hypothetical protein ABIT83_01185 [Massilia sp.]
MNIHIRVVGALHIVIGALALAVLVALYCFFSAVLDLFGISGDFARTLAGLASAVAIPVALIGLGQILAAVLMLCGVRWARVFVIVFAIVGLVNVPIGSVIGLYTLWALLLSEREAARDAAAEAALPAP